MSALNKQKGNIGEAKCLAKMVELGVPVCLPFGDNERYDMIIERNGKLEKIQIKYSSQQENEGSIVFKTASSANHTTNKHYSTYENDVDAFLLYNALTDEVYYVPMEIIGTKKTLTMRMQPSKNGQIKNCLFTSDYLAENYF